VRRIVIIGILATFLALSAYAADERRPCIGLLDEPSRIDGAIPQPDQPTPPEAGPPLLTENECEAVKRHELHMRLMEIPQEKEDPMGLSLGSRDEGGILYFRIPFSF
jgi:hypothetical protein